MKVKNSDNKINMYCVVREGVDENEQILANKQVEKNSEERTIIKDGKIYDISKYTGMRVARPQVYSTSYRKEEVIVKESPKTIDAQKEDKNTINNINDTNSLVEEKVQIEVNEAPIKEVVHETSPTIKAYAQNVIEQESKRAQSHKITRYIPPKNEFLTIESMSNNEDIVEAEEQKKIIDDTFKKSSIGAHVYKYIFGPTVTQFLIEVDDGVNVNILHKCQANLTMYLSKAFIRIQTPIPGKSYAGIEVPKNKSNRRKVYLGDLLLADEFKTSSLLLPVALGQDNYGKYMYMDLTEMPHALIAGTTKSGKSVCLNTFIVSLIYKFNPNDVRLVLIDPKNVEFKPYDGIPHLAMPVVTEEEDFPRVLAWLTDEMERRYHLFGIYSVKNLAGFNRFSSENKQEPMPYLVMIMDEFSDWFADCSQEVENYLQKLAQKARAAGIHIILAAQRPSKDVIKGTIKANFDTRIAFKVSSFEDSKVILGGAGAETLEGYGDVLVRYAGESEKRLQGCFIPDDDIRKIVLYLRNNNSPDYLVTLEELKQKDSTNDTSNLKDSGLLDEQFCDVAFYVVRNKSGSMNAVTNEFGMGFNRVNAIFNALENLGILSSVVHGKAREVLVSEDELTDILSEQNLLK